MWFLPLLAPLLPYLRMSSRQASAMLVMWIAGQAIWLATAYQLEYRAKEVFLTLWAAGVLLFGVIEGFDPGIRRKTKVD